MKQSIDSWDLPTSSKIGVGIAGLGLAGGHHIDAVRRLGVAEIVAVASSHPDLAHEKAARYGIPKIYASFEDLASDPAVDVVHVTTPNHLHRPAILAALRQHKHVICDKPLAMTATEASELLQAADAAGVVHAVTFTYRGNALVQEARCRIAQEAVGRIHFVHGAYLQDWLLEETDYSWRLDRSKSGLSCTLADIGSHWCDLAEHITGLKIESVLADLTTVIPIRQKPLHDVQTFFKADKVDCAPVKVESEDLASVLVRFNNGAKGCFSVGQVCAGHKNDLWIEVNGATNSIRWDRARSEELWIGHRHQANEVLPRDQWLLAANARRFAQLPGSIPTGHSEDLLHVLADIYATIKLPTNNERDVPVKIGR